MQGFLSTYYSILKKYDMVLYPSQRYVTASPEGEIAKILEF